MVKKHQEVEEIVSGLRKELKDLVSSLKSEIVKEIKNELSLTGEKGEGPSEEENEVISEILEIENLENFKNKFAEDSLEPDSETFVKLKDLNRMVDERTDFSAASESLSLFSSFEEYDWEDDLFNEEGFQSDADLSEEVPLLTQVLSEDYVSVDRQEFHWEFKINRSSLSEFTLQTNPVNREISDTYQGLQKSIPVTSVLTPIDSTEKYFVWECLPVVDVINQPDTVDTHLNFRYLTVPFKRESDYSNAFSEKELREFFEGLKHYYLNSKFMDDPQDLIVYEYFNRGVSKYPSTLDVIPDNKDKRSIFLEQAIDYIITQDLFFAKEVLSLSEGRPLTLLKPSQLIYLMFKYPNFVYGLVKSSKLLSSLMSKLATKEFKAFPDLLLPLSKSQLVITQPGDLQGLLNQSVDFVSYFTAEVVSESLNKHGFHSYAKGEREVAFFAEDFTTRLTWEVNEKSVLFTYTTAKLTYRDEINSLVKFENFLTTLKKIAL